uniref:uncharacterized protein LOC120329841 n=1 Tax=Styela clava TaxID=7725 RepID=UPI001939287C|nr:uncharacterized protein LOC120329841 [Styela clava]
MVKRSYCKNMDFIIWNILIVIVALKITLVDGGCTRPLPGMDQTRYTKHLQIGITSRTEVESIRYVSTMGEGKQKLLKSAYHSSISQYHKKKARTWMPSGNFIREEKEKNSGDMGWLLSYVDRTVPEQCVQDALRALHNP